MPLTKDEIVAAIAARKRETKAIDVPEWGGKVLIRRLDADGLDDTGMLSVDAKPSADMMVKMIALSLCDDDGEPLFGLDELRAMHEVDAEVTLKVFEACSAYNGLTAPEAEAMVAGFDEAPRDGSSTD
jgi:hypothetical protein